MEAGAPAEGAWSEERETVTMGGGTFWGKGEEMVGEEEEEDFFFRKLKRLALVRISFMM